jgi:ribonuclease D
MSQYTWVDQSDLLASLCQQWSRLSHIGLDTEFIRERTFYPIAALIQVNDGDKNYLIDPTVITDLSPLKVLLQDTECIKVMHSCSEDLEVFAKLLNCHVEPLADTQLAAALLGLGPALGYANICKMQLGIDVDKGETRSNWLQRPLTESQCHYAALDVEHLLPLYDTLLDQLEASGKADLFDQECERIEFQSLQAMDFQEAFTRIKAAWKMPAHELNRLRSLAAWREEQARFRDMPRNHVIRDLGLINIVQRNPQRPEDFKGLLEVSPAFVRKYGETMLELLRKADAVPKEHWPERMDKPLSKGQAKLMSQLKDTLMAVADNLAISPELLASKRDLEPVIRAKSANRVINLHYLRSPWRIAAYREACQRLNIACSASLGDLS